MPLYDFECIHPEGCRKVTEELVPKGTQVIVCECGRYAYKSEMIRPTNLSFSGLPTPKFH